MKFLCGNCKAKYQIADEKVSGRTLRMKCRRCGHDILIDGHNMPASNPPAAAAAPPRRAGSASVVPAPPRAGSGAQSLPPRPGTASPALPRPTTSRSKPPSTLGAEFRRHMAAPPEVPKRTAPYDLWHVAIKDVPVGPMTREELGRKIEAGAVNADSLCWREGMDDWRPLGGLPELSQLLRRGREAARSRPPPRPRPPPHVPAPQGSRPSQFPPPEPDEYEDEYSEPTRIADLQPGLSTHASSPKIVVPQQQPGGSSGSVSVQMEAPPAAVPARQGGKGASALTTGIAVGLLIGILLVGGPMLYRNTWGTPAPTPGQQAVVNPTPAQKTTDLAARDIEVDIPSEPDEKTQPGAAGKGPRPGTPAARAVKPENKGKELSEEERRLLERMGQGGGEINLDDKRARPAAETAGTGPALTASQLSKVVQDNKVQLQRCYETALRATGGKQEGAIKVTVNVTVGTSGMSKGVATQGTGLGNMNECIKQAVKRWRFPQSGGESEFAFPLVFQPGA
jgi:predicted Zn finger-like uncharacterized protein